MHISIVMAYYNRRNLLINTLHSINKSKYNKQLEIVIVDDASDANINDIATIFPLLNFKIITIKKEDKWWVNPCIPTNIGIRGAVGDVIIIQNPECLHTGDILSVVESNIGRNKYLVFGCYAIGHNETNLISNVNINSPTYFNDINSIIEPLNNISTHLCGGRNKWYQHSMYNSGEINFCTAIMKEDLEDLGGFDEKFANGIGKDDREFILRVRKKNMEIIVIDKPFVIHQCHGYTDYSNKKLVERNNLLFSETMDSDEYKVSN